MATSSNNTHVTKKNDVIIIGAGVLGSALAMTLARKGRNVLIIEQSLKEPDRIVGELLQPGGVAALEKLGLRECLEEIDAIPVEGYNICYRGKDITFRYPLVGTKNDPLLLREKKRPEGRSFHHRKFVKKLRAEVEIVQTTATTLIKDNNSAQIIGVECSDKQEVRGLILYVYSPCLVPLFWSEQDLIFKARILNHDKVLR